MTCATAKIVFRLEFLNGKHNRGAFLCYLNVFSGGRGVESSLLAVSFDLFLKKKRLLVRALRIKVILIY